MSKKTYNVHFLNMSEDYYASFSTRQKAEEVITQFNNLAQSINIPERLDDTLRIIDADIFTAKELRLCYSASAYKNIHTDMWEINLEPHIVDKTIIKDFSSGNGRVFLGENRLDILDKLIIWLRSINVDINNLRFMCGSVYSGNPLFSSANIREYIQNNWDK